MLQLQVENVQRFTEQRWNGTLGSVIVGLRAEVTAALQGVRPARGQIFTRGCYVAECRGRLECDHQFAGLRLRQLAAICVRQCRELVAWTIPVGAESDLAVMPGVVDFGAVRRRRVTAVQISPVDAIA